MNQPYERPSIVVIGTLGELTLGVGGGPPIDQCFNQGNGAPLPNQGSNDPAGPNQGVDCVPTGFGSA